VVQGLLVLVDVDQEVVDEDRQRACFPWEEKIQVDRMPKKK
jgi:hypothetical protein